MSEWLSYLTAFVMDVNGAALTAAPCFFLPTSVPLSHCHLPGYDKASMLKCPFGVMQMESSDVHLTK